MPAYNHPELVAAKEPRMYRESPKNTPAPVSIIRVYYLTSGTVVWSFLVASVVTLVTALAWIAFGARPVVLRGIVVAVLVDLVAGWLMLQDFRAYSYRERGDREEPASPPSAEKVLRPVPTALTRPDDIGDA